MGRPWEIAFARLVRARLAYFTLALKTPLFQFVTFSLLFLTPDSLQLLWLIGLGISAILILDMAEKRLGFRRLKGL